MGGSRKGDTGRGTGQARPASLRAAQVMRACTLPPRHALAPGAAQRRRGYKQSRAPPSAPLPLRPCLRAPPRQPWQPRQPRLAGPSARAPPGRGWRPSRSAGSWAARCRPPPRCRTPRTCRAPCATSAPPPRPTSAARMPVSEGARLRCPAQRCPLPPRPPRRRCARIPSCLQPRAGKESRANAARANGRTEARGVAARGGLGGGVGAHGGRRRPRSKWSTPWGGRWR